METSNDKKMLQLNEKGTVLPYFIGWLMGVPLSILLLIAMFRTVF